MDLIQKCLCGNIKVQLVLPKLLKEYQPRTCDCDFCTQRNASYISDPKGSMKIEIINSDKLELLQQGSNQAKFLSCKGCQELVAVIYQDGNAIYGAYNAGLSVKLFGDPISVSPKKLSPEEKISRWKEVWFRNVQITPPLT